MAESLPPWDKQRPQLANFQREFSHTQLTVGKCCYDCCLPRLFYTLNSRWDKSRTRGGQKTVLGGHPTPTRVLLTLASSGIVPQPA